MPAQKWGPRPEITMTAALWLWSRRESALGSSVKKSRVRALRWEGRLSWTWKMGRSAFFCVISRVLNFSSILFDSFGGVVTRKNELRGGGRIGSTILLTNYMHVPHFNQFSKEFLFVCSSFYSI